MLKKLFLIISLLLLVRLGWHFLGEYNLQHTYYADMLKNRQNWKIVLVGLIFALIPACYLLFSKTKQRWGVVISLFVGLALFNISYVAIKADLFGGSIKLVINVAILLGLALYMLVALLTIGTYIKERLLKLHTEKIFDVILNLGIGLSAFLLVSFFLILTDLFFPIVNWLLFAGAGLLMWFSKEKLLSIWKIVCDTVEPVAPKKVHPIWYVVVSLPLLAYGILSFVNADATLWSWILLLISGGLIFGYISSAMSKDNWGIEEIFSVQGAIRVFTFLLVLLSLWYIFNGFALAFIPYPTAWDANHLYMFYPKMWALNNGFYRDTIGMAGSAQLRYGFISYWFSLFAPFNNFLGLSSDTIAIEMNFWSGFLVLIFGLGLVAEVIAYLQGEERTHPKQIHGFIFLIGWFLLLQWLMSGMGAFLVFIDNKTDLGVLALIILAIYSGFVFLRQAHHEDEMILPTHHHHRTARYLIGLSGFFYAIAALAKPTALFDVVNFGLFARWTWFGRLGVIGGSLLIVGALAAMKFAGIKNYLPASVGAWLIPIGTAGVAADVVRGFIKKSKIFAHYMLIWAGVFLITFVIVKLPQRIADHFAFDRDPSATEFIKNFFLGKNNDESRIVANDKSGLSMGRQFELLAQATGIGVGDVADTSGTAVNTIISGPRMCNLSSQGLSTPEQLYEKTKKFADIGNSEDVGRYTGYGWKGNASDVRRNIYPFLNPRWAFMRGPGCHGFNPFGLPTHDAKLLCETEAQRKSLDVEQMTTIYDQLKPTGEAATMLEGLITLIASDTRSVQEKANSYEPQFQALDSYMQDNSVRVIINTEGEKEVYFPYKFLNPFNISFNRSLQNLSSYYTDIGLVWIILYIFTIVGLIYGLISRKQPLVGISIVTQFGWVMRWFVGGGILWYAIGIIAWTILSFLFYIYYLLDDDDTQATTILSYLFIFAFIAFGGIQMVLNLVRISSQGGGGAFIWYKTNYGVQQNLTDSLQSANAPAGGFVSDDVFNLQFPHYRDLLDIANERKEGDGVFVAGTYARYFIKDQSYVRDDDFLSWLWEMSSDNDTCNTYLRLQDSHVKYLVIDPNIGTVVQGAGNQSLFDRFFGRINSVTNAIDAHGAMTMLASLFQDGYLRYISSNNLGAKYAYTMPNSVFGGLQGDQLTLFRARMSVARYFGNSMVAPIVEIAMQRVKDGTFVTDLADMMGLQIDDAKLMNIILKGQPTVADIGTLTQDERKALQQFISIRQEAAAGDDALRQQITTIVSNNIVGGNQLIVLELVD